MSPFLASLKPHLRGNANERYRQVYSRVGLTALVSWALVLIGRGDLIGPWLATSLSVQILEFVAVRPFAKGRLPERHLEARIALMLVAMVAMAAVHAGAVLIFWVSGEPPLMALALMVLVGGALNNVASGVDSRPLFYLGVTPYALSLAAMPVLIWRTSHQQVTILAVSVGFFLLALHTIWGRMHRGRRAVVAAREEADRRRIQTEEALSDRTAMAAIVSHELRTPLSAILAGAHLIRTGSSPVQTHATAELIVDAGNLMTGLLTDMLDQAKIEARAMCLEDRNFDLLGAIRDATRFWSANAKAKGLILREPPGEQPSVWVRGDPFRLRQILNNLLSNAVKFTEEGVIALSLVAEAAGDQVRVTIEVRDNGPGITEDAMDRLFTPYAQASQETARTYGGTGLGLAVSRQLARLMGGELDARAAPGRGAIFRLTLRLLAGREEAVTRPAAAPAPAAPAFGALKVLAVDDHEVNRRTLALVLEPMGVALTTAPDGLEALRHLEAERYDVVLMDVNMPGLDGREATRRLRAAKGRNHDVPVIGFSAGVSDDEVEACRAAGMNDWLAKPLDIRALYAALDRIQSRAKPPVEA